MKKRTCVVSAFACMAAMMISSCTRGDLYSHVYAGQETHTVFNISVAKNTKTKTHSKSQIQTKAVIDSKTSYEYERTEAYISPDVAFGLVGINDGHVIIDNLPVFENNGLRTADIVTFVESENRVNVSAFYPYVKDVTYDSDGSYAISFTPDDIKKGPLASNTVDFRCDQTFETVNLRFIHLANSIGFKLCDITEDEQLKGLMHVRKIIVHGMPTEGSFVMNDEEGHWVPNAKHAEIVCYEGNEPVGIGEENALYVTGKGLSAEKSQCNRFYVVPEEFKAEKHYVELLFDVDEFDYDGTHYRATTGRSEKIPLSGVIPDDLMELGVQYTFVLGMNLGSIYRPIEFTATVENWEEHFNGRIVDYEDD